MATQTAEKTAFDGIYEVTEAARYLRVTMPRIPGNPQKIYSSKLIRWIRYGLASPSLTETPGREVLINFEDLISMRAISFMRYFGYSFRDIHKAHAFLCDRTGHDKPFATELLWIEDLGAANIYAEIESMLAIANRGGQLVFKELVRDRLIPIHNMKFEYGIAESWTPKTGIELDRRVQFGRPCIEGTRIPASDIVGMYKAGDSVEFLAESYGLSEEQIDNAIAWEGTLATEKVRE
jgi:uncharacterized protein (DUF433 family)